MSDSQVRTLLEIVQMSTGYLTEHGSDSPRLDAEVLVAHALGMQRLELYLKFDRPMDAAELSEIRALLRRRGGGEPVAYITGHREFYGREFQVNDAVLVPRPDTETLIELVLGALNDTSGEIRVLDVGTGSGCIALTLAAEIPHAQVVATDISADALEVARRNAAKLDVAERVDARQGSWGEPLRGSEVFDVICSNPPYVLAEELPELMRDVREHEPHVALVDTGGELDAYRRVCDIAAQHLAPDGLLALEINPKRASEVRDLVAVTLPRHTATVHRDLAGHERAVLAVPNA